MTYRLVLAIQSNFAQMNNNAVFSNLIDLEI